MDSMAKDEMDGMVRVEWLKSRARVHRAQEDLVLLQAEKERVLLSFRKDATDWDGRTSGWAGLEDPLLLEGITAHGNRQAEVYRTLAAHCELTWSKPVKAKKARIKDRIDLKEHEVEVEDEEEPVDGAAQDPLGEAVPVISSTARDLDATSSTQSVSPAAPVPMLQHDAGLPRGPLGEMTPLSLSTTAPPLIPPDDAVPPVTPPPFIPPNDAVLPSPANA